MITGHWYMIVALILIVLIFYGPGKLPEIGGAVGKAMREFRKSVDSVKAEVAAVPGNTTATTQDVATGSGNTSPVDSGTGIIPTVEPTTQK